MSFPFNILSLRCGKVKTEEIISNESIVLPNGRV